MQKTTRLSLLGLAIATLAVTTPSAPTTDMKPYKGWVLFPPVTAPDGTATMQVWDNIGGYAIQVATPTWSPPVADGETWIVVVHMLGTITYGDGSQLFDDCTVTVVYDQTFLFALRATMEGTITGGTGRFEGASGSLSGDEWFEEPINLATGEQVRTRVEGRVSTVGSLRRAQVVAPIVD